MQAGRQRQRQRQGRRGASKPTKDKRKEMIDAYMDSKAGRPDGHLTSDWISPDQEASSVTPDKILLGRNRQWFGFDLTGLALSIPNMFRSFQT